MKGFGNSLGLAYNSLTFSKEIVLPTPILATKLYIPHTRPNLVPRPRLIKQLTEGFCSGGKLTLISAPAGSGKTTLLAALPHAFPDLPLAWLTLDQDDNDPATFLMALRPNRILPSFVVKISSLSLMSGGNTGIFIS